MKPIYLDYNATTPLDPAVVAAMAELLGAAPDEIVFTGGGSEASNLALKGAAFPLLTGPRADREVHIVTTEAEVDRAATLLGEAAR
jgi:cysteine sulfinate desulfinase/cysteine desulfurase-like protein